MYLDGAYLVIDLGFSKAFDSSHSILAVRGTISLTPMTTLNLPALVKDILINARTAASSAYASDDERRDHPRRSSVVPTA